MATALLKEQKIHEGLWSLFVRFGLNAANLGPNEDELKPCAVIPILEIGLQKGEKENSITVDAAKVNPRPPQLIPDTSGRRQYGTESQHNGPAISPWSREKLLAHSGRSNRKGHHFQHATFTKTALIPRGFLAGRRYAPKVAAT